MKNKVLKRLLVCGMAAALTFTNVSGVFYAAETNSETTENGGSESGTQSGPGNQGGPGGGFPGGGPGGPGGGQKATADPLTDTIMDVVLNVGETEDSVSVTWYALGEGEQKLQIVKSSNVNGNVFPTAGYTEYNATATKTNYTVETTEATEGTEAVSTTYYSQSVTLSGLEAGVSYSYRVSGTDAEGNTVWSDLYTYSPEDLSDGFSFLVVGDPQIGTGGRESDTEGWQKTMQTALSNFPGVSFILSAGDQIDAYSSGDTLENEYYGFLSEDALLSSLPIAPALGNHDAGRGDGGANAYTTHYTLPNVSSYGSSDSSSTGEEDYYFTYGNTLFMVLNTNNSSIAEHKAFLEETIAANEDCTWRIVVFHQSIYSVASHVNDGNIADLRTGLSPVFVENDIDVVLMGHDHVYARSYMMGGETGMEADIQKDADGNALTEFTDPDGVQYITLNSSSGSKYYNITQELFEYTAVQNQEKTPNYSCVSIDEDSFTITTYRTEDQSVVDTVTINKTVETKDTDSDFEEDVDDENKDVVSSSDVIVNSETADVTINNEAGVLEAGTTLTAVQVESGDEYKEAAALVEKNVTDYSNYAVFDIDLTDASGVEIHQLDGYVQVTLALPFTLGEKSGLNVYRVDDGKLTKLESTVENGKVTFKTNHFSTYVFVETSQNTNSSVPETGDKSMTGLWIAVMILGLGACAVGIYKKKIRFE